MHSILVIGVGSIGERHVRCFQNTGRADVSICELNPELGRTVAERYGIARSFDNLRVALTEPPDAAVICTPAHLHIPLATELARAGVHLLIEKPLSTKPEGISELLGVLEAQGLKASVAYVLRAHPMLQEMRTAIQSGRIGKPVEVLVTSGQHFPLYRPAYREIYYTRHETGGGAVQDALTHMLNAAEWVVGPITKLVADLDHLVLEGVDVEDSVHVITRHGRVMGNFTLNQHQFPNESTLTVICERGTARFEAHNLRWMSCIEAGAEWNVEATCQLERDDLFIRQADAFLDLLEGTTPPACPLIEAEQTLKVNLAILNSANQHTWCDP